MFSKSFVNGARVGKFIATSNEAIVAGTREVGSAFKWIGSEVAKDSLSAVRSVKDFAAGVRYGARLCRTCRAEFN
jgi:hypothetical protein